MSEEITTGELCGLLGVSRATIATLTRNGTLRKIARGRYRTSEAVKAYIAHREHEVRLQEAGLVGHLRPPRDEGVGGGDDARLRCADRLEALHGEVEDVWRRLCALRSVAERRAFVESGELDVLAAFHREFERSLEFWSDVERPIFADYIKFTMANAAAKILGACEWDSPPLRQAKKN
jgi:excisionase family DNA binding protein